VEAVQVDFDATASEREFYRRLIRRLRERLRADVMLSVTALASWCAGDDWLAGLPVDEAVPMLFRMGPFNERFRGIAERRTGAASVCRNALGISLDEPFLVRRQQRRLYVFSPRPWDNDGIRAALQESRR
jgi:hypothetical protein